MDRSEFPLVELRLDIDLLSRPVRAKGLGKYIRIRIYMA